MQKISGLNNNNNKYSNILQSGRRPVVKLIAESLSQHDEEHVVPTPLSGIRVGGRRRKSLILVNVKHL
jgi:hypothetical protein